MTHTHTSTDLAHEIAARAEQAGQQTTEYLASEHGRAVAAALAARADDDSDDDCARVVALVTLCEVCCTATATLETDGEFRHVCADCARLA
jgi:hypothetical protein